MKYWFELDGQFVIGEGGIDLLRAIDTTGSLAGAAKTMGWSYRHSWGYLRRAETTTGLKLTATRSGKGAARGIDLTHVGRQLLVCADATRKTLHSRGKDA